MKTFYKGTAPQRRKFMKNFWTVPLIVWQKILLICSNILPPIFHTTNLANISCEVLFWIIIFSYSKVWQEKSNFLIFRRPCDICKPMWHCHKINEIAVCVLSVLILLRDQSIALSCLSRVNHWYCILGNVNRFQKKNFQCLCQN